MCNCTTNPCGCDSGISLPYLTGDAGQDGIFGGFSAEWKFDASSILSSPSAAYIRFNSPTYSSVTEIYINQTNIDLLDHSNFLDTFTNDNNYGLIRIWKQHDSTKFWLGTITGTNDNGLYRTFNVTHIQSNDTFTSDDNVVVNFTPTGTPGADGVDGADGADGIGAYVVDAIFSGTVPAGSATTILGEINIPANTLSTDEDMLEFSATMTRTQNSADDDLMVISFGYQGYILYTGELVSNGKFKGYLNRITGRIVRKDSSTVTVEIETMDAGSPVITGPLQAQSVANISFDNQAFDPTQINKLQILFLGTTIETITLHNFQVNYIKRTT